MFRPALIALAGAALMVSACQQSAAEAQPGPQAPPKSQSASRANPTGGMCGGIGGFSCADANDYCKHPQGQCQVADGSGVCTPKTQMCTQIFKPVCGCDGKTYPNDCMAGAAGVSVDHEGECKG